MRAFGSGGAHYDALVVTETEQLDRSTNTKSPAQRGPLASVFRDSLQFMRNGDGTYQLFNVVNDYAQGRDLLEAPAGCVAATTLDAMLRGVARQPSTPAYTMARCGARVAVGDSVPAEGPVRP